MNSFRNGETPTEAYIRHKKELIDNIKINQKEKEMEDRIYNRVLKRLNFIISNNAKKEVKELNEIINNLGKEGK